MSATLLPRNNSYFAIYTLEPPRGQNARGMNWDLHATATDRDMAISHARLLALQPGVTEVQVKQVMKNRRGAIVDVRDVTRCKRSPYAGTLRWVGASALLGVLAAIAQCVLIQ